MLHDAQRMSAPSAARVSISTAVWIVMCSEPAMRAPRSGCSGPYSSRVAISPGISISAMAISLRPHSASPMSLTTWSLDLLAAGDVRVLGEAVIWSLGAVAADDLEKWPAYSKTARAPQPTYKEIFMSLLLLPPRLWGGPGWGLLCGGGRLVKRPHPSPPRSRGGINPL